MPVMMMYEDVTGDVASLVSGGSEITTPNRDSRQPDCHLN
jgi:hypothetical protein